MTQRELNTIKKVRAFLFAKPHDDKPSGDMTFCPSMHGQKLVLDGTEVDPAKYINDTTRVWRESWIKPLLDALIAKGEGTITPTQEWMLDHAMGPGAWPWEGIS